MNEVVLINGHEIAVKEYNGQRVVTFNDIDTVHERPDGTAGRNFRANKKHFIDGEDFYVVSEGDEIRRLGIFRPQGGFPEKVILITESGYYMLAKSLTDDHAWDVQRKLVKTYFRAHDLFSNMSPELRAVIVVDQRVTAVEKRVDHLENDIPLYGSESDELSRAVKKRGVSVMGGKSSNAYKDTKLRSEVYADIYNLVKREYGLLDSNGKYVTYKALKRRYLRGAFDIVEKYEPPTYLAEKIEDSNAQITLENEDGLIT